MAGLFLNSLPGDDNVPNSILHVFSSPPEEKNLLVKLLMDTYSSQDSLLEDHLLLTNRINIHRCSDYCLRQTKPMPMDHSMGLREFLSVPITVDVEHWTHDAVEI
jgi:hypothetical protein